MVKKEKDFEGAKVVSEIKKRSFKVEKDGEVIMTEELLNVVTMSYREFLTYFREHEKAIENISLQLSPERQTEIMRELEKIKERKEELVTPLKLSEKNALSHHVELLKESNLLKLREELSKKKSLRDDFYVYRFVDGLKPEIKDFVESKLSSEEHFLLADIVSSCVKKNKRKNV